MQDSRRLGNLGEARIKSIVSSRCGLSGSGGARPMTSSIVWVAFTAFSIALIATGLMRRYALQRNLIDIPNARSSHASPTPRGGGVAIVFAFFTAALLLTFLGLLDARLPGALLVGGGAMALVGFLDDRRHLRASVRFCVHLAAAIWVVTLLGGVSESAPANWGLRGLWTGRLFVILTLVWTTNLFNFMDGLDGIACSEAIFVSGAGAWLNWHEGGPPGLTAAMACLSATCMGFLRWNWPPARIFMGDVGSGFLGFSLAVLGLAASQKGMLPIEIWAILGGVFLVDATVTLVRRLARGDRWFEAHRTHAYQNLARRWKAHLPVTILVTMINILWLLPLAILAANFPVYARWFLVAALSPLIVLVVAFGAGVDET
jgi:Fuc2NAc and GlcNAc transferase